MVEICVRLFDNTWFSHEYCLLMAKTQISLVMRASADMLVWPWFYLEPLFWNHNVSRAIVYPVEGKDTPVPICRWD